MSKIFISYNKADRQWAEWIGWHLEENGFETVLQAWDFTAGSNFVLEMHKAAKDTDCTMGKGRGQAGSQIRCFYCRTARYRRG
jgi:hypothetical protein